MKKLTVQARAKRLVAAFFTAALGAGACFAQSAPRIELAAEAAAKGSTVVASLADFSATRVEIGQLKGYSQTLAPAVLFLRTYYQLGRNAERDALLKLYAPGMQAGVARRFKDGNAVGQAFADLGEVDVDSAVSWGYYRVVLPRPMPAAP